MNTYQERVGRYRILKHEDMPEAHKAEYRINGIDPDTLWTLVWSFDDLIAANDCLKDEQGYAASWQTYKLVDGGHPTTIERTTWF